MASFGFTSTLQQTTYSDQIFELLKDKILRAEIAAGEKLNANEIAQQLNVSVSPVRDAIMRLESFGLAKRQGKYKVVATPCAKEMMDYLDIREALETLALKLVEKPLRNEWKAEIQEIIDQLKELDSDNKGIDFMHKSTEFHLYLAKRCGNQAVYDSLSDICQIMLLTNIEKYKQSHELRTFAIEEHQKLADLLFTEQWGEYETRLGEHIKEWRNVIS